MKPNSLRDKKYTPACLATIFKKINGNSLFGTNIQGSNLNSKYGIGFASYDLTFLIEPKGYILCQSLAKLN